MRFKSQLILVNLNNFPYFCIMDGMRIKVFNRMSLLEVDVVNNFLKEIGNAVVKVDSFACEKNDSRLNFVVTYKEGYYINNKDYVLKVKSFTTISDLNEFLKEIGDRFHSKESMYSDGYGYTHHFVTYYEPVEDRDRDKDKSSDKKELQENKIEEVMG